VDQLADARAEVETHRVGLRKVEDELRAALEARDELQPSGLLGMFRASPDPARMEELDAVIEVLKEELKIRRQTVHQARQAVEEQESNIARGAAMPTQVVDLASAVVTVQGLKRLDRLLTELRTIAARAEQARDAVPMTRSGGRGQRRADPAAPAKRASAVAEHTDNWEPLVDRAELVADLVAFPLVLPRRWDADARPDHAPQPTAEMALARQAATTQSREDFGVAIAFTRTDIDQQRRRIWTMLEVVKENYPRAEEGGATQPFDPLQAIVHETAAKAPSADPGPELRKQWEALRSTHDALAALSARGARTIDYLDTMAHWQRQAMAVGQLPIARAHQLLPPVNEGGNLSAFVARLLAEWPALDERYGQVVEQRGPS